MAERTSYDVMFEQVLPTRVKTRLNEWIKSSSSVSIFVTGKAGTGKSTLVNGIVGSEVCKVGKSLRPETSKVQQCHEKIGGIQVRVWDSPGLQDGTAKESEYLDDIKRNCRGNVDLFLCCIKMSATRFVSGNPDIKAMKQLTTTLGTDIWRSAVIVLTFANVYIMRVEDDFDEEGLREKYLHELELWKNIVHRALEEEVGLDPQLAKKVAVVPAGDGNTPEILPGDGLWLSKLWKEALTVTRPSAQPAFVMLNISRLAEKVNVGQDALLLHQQSLVLPDIGKMIGIASKGYL